MANASLSASFQVMLDRINACGELLEVFRADKLGAFLKRLKKTLLTAYAVLGDAEHKEDLDAAVKHWLDELKDAFYQVEDVLDEISTEALQRRLEAEDGIKGRVWNWKLLSSPSSLNKRIEHRSEAIIERLEGHMKHITPIGLREYKAGRSFQRLRVSPTLADQSKVFGRDEDQQAILNLLLSDDCVAGQDLCVVPIVGMAGVGKTALAQLVYQDSRVNDHFDLKAWVCLGEYLDVFRMMKATLQEFNPEPCDNEDLSSLQVGLEKILTGKKFLLVLDDVWSENCSDWECFRLPLNAGARGSKIVVTTRSSVVASTIGQSVQRYDLKLLPDEDCWELFSKLAFENKQAGSYPELEAIGKKIVKKCNGLPLAAKAVAAQLRTKLTVEEWHAALKNFQHYTEDILPVLKLSYDALPGHLKRCFAYCSIFPKGYQFETEKLVLLWMAEGLLQQPKSDRKLEDIGQQYFSDLISGSFFLHSSGKRSHFVMHDLMNDLAESVSGEFSFRLEGNGTSQISGKVRHFSFSRSECDAETIIGSIYGAKHLRTILPFELPPDLESSRLTNKVLQDLLLKQQCLRVLSLSHYNIARLPESIGSLKLLRYLDLSDTAIKKLPDLVCTLYNLQTLLLSNCKSLNKLPTNMGKLINLRYLDLVGTSLKEMPTGMSKLKSLQMLSNFVVARLSGSGIEELKELVCLRGTLCISELQNVVFAKEAKEASMKRKQYLEGLVLKWSGRGYSYSGFQTFACDQQEVLESLQPHPNLKSLSIKFYQGTRYPGWVGDLSYSNMVFLCLSNCNFCLSLPPLGQLPSLRDLIIERLDGVQKVGPEFYGTNVPQVKPFRSLRTLKFDGMLRWEEWISPEVEGGAFPCLQELWIRRCPKLIRDLPKNLPPSVKLYISDCQQLEDTISSIQSTDESYERDSVEMLAASSSGLQSLSELQLHDSGNFSIDEELIQSSSGYSIKDETFYENKELSKQHYEMLAASPGLPEIEDLQWQLPDDEKVRSRLEYETAIEYSKDISTFESLKVSEVAELMELPSGLHSLQIEGSDVLESLPKGLMGRNTTLQDLFLISCSGLKSFAGGYPPITLKSLYLRDCRKFEFIQFARTMHQFALLEYLSIGSSCDKIQSFPLAFFPKLKSLSIWDCANFSSISIPKGIDDSLLKLETLEIRDCPNLVSFPEGGLPTLKLTSILLSNCKNLKALPDRLYRLSSLESLFMNECPKLAAVPEGGFPSNLNTLCIIYCPNLIQQLDWTLQKLENLCCFEIEGGCRDVESFPDAKLLPGNLYSLRISELVNLKSLNQTGLKHLTYLEMLEISSCNKLESLPDGGLPSSVSLLRINDCSLLKAELQNKKGKEWYKIAHIPHVEIDGEMIS